MIDLLKVVEIKYPGQVIRYKEDVAWVEFGGEKPYDYVLDQEIIDYNSLLSEAQAYHSQGLLADWEGFIEQLPVNALAVHLITQRHLSIDLHLAITDLLLLVALPNLRLPSLILSFWQTLLIQVAEHPELNITEELRTGWNVLAEEHCLPDDMMLTLTGV